MQIRAKPWIKKNHPGRVLAIRLQAMGDVFGALPLLQDLRNTLPAATMLDFLTRKETDDIPRNIILFDTVYSIGGKRDIKKQLLSAGLLLPRLLMNRYDVVLDLQNNMISRMVRKTLRPAAWSEFDRYSPISGTERYRLTIEAAGIAKNKMEQQFHLRDPTCGLSLLHHNGFSGGEELVVLNPAGAFETRNWPLEHYVSFAKLWRLKFPKSRFLLLGTRFLETKATVLKQQLGEQLINLVGKTTAHEAFAILQHTKLILSEDSGLMHMAWGSGIPTVALFGSSRSDWSGPLGAHSLLLDAADLPCGACMETFCRFGDVHCLTRYTPEEVVQQAAGLIQRLEKRYMKDTFTINQIQHPETNPK
ncbi:MAG TPA: glycosyltransferase family 9 protein [Puia sp.]|nr:glycosyltransferase family 9 protein [Puia sp.]